MCGLPRNAQARAGSSRSPANVSTPVTGSVEAQTYMPQVLPALTIRSQPLTSPPVMPAMRWFNVLQKLTVAEETMYLRLGNWRRESQCLGDGSEQVGPCSLPWVSVTTAWTGGVRRRCAFATASRLARFELQLEAKWKCIPETGLEELEMLLFW